MKKHMLISFALLPILVAIPGFTYAYGMPLGARVGPPVPGIVCTGTGTPTPFMLQTIRGAAGPYAAKGKTIRTGQWVLGTYNVVKDMTSCKDASGNPYPVYMINPGFGTSR